MSGPICITGASGFIGQRAVSYARLINLPIRALVRSENRVPVGWANDGGIDVRARDLSDAPDLAQLLDGVSTLIHAAAAISGDHERNTIGASQRLADAVGEAGVTHVVLVSSISVYDVTTLADGVTLDENCAINAEGRDDYAAAKLAQEQIFQAAAQQHGFALTILRPGAVFGPNRLFNAHIGPALGPLVFSIDGGGQVPVCNVDLLAQCLIRAAQTPGEVRVINIVDDALPDRTRFLNAFRTCGWPKATLGLPLGLARFLATITPNSSAMPGLLRRKVLEARHKPLRYDNAVMHKRLGPVTMLPFETAMQNAIEIEQDLAQ